VAGIYIHIPFCRKRCIYCDFFSSTDTKEKEEYVNELCRELRERKDYLHGQTVETVYFGGGTPSQLTAENFDKIFDAMEIDFNQSIEVTLEVNPDDITLPYIDSIRPLPFNRISMGIQSFNDKELSFLNRRHDSETAIRAFKLLQKNDFENISIDLIYGIPGQTPAIWKENIRKAIALNVPHISAYHLTYEEGTPLFTLLEQKRTTPVDEILSLHLFDILIDTLTGAGFEQYEISNFAKPGFRSKHNSSYWNGTHYLGIGASAHSYNGVSRQWNPRIGGANYRANGFEMEIIDEKTAYNDFVLTHLRTMEGINLHELESLFGENTKTHCLKQSQKYIENRMLEQVNNHLRLTRKGIFISDSIISDIMVGDL
jgi:oxygen-independent coproporphyrinogen-3 oxidase